MLAERDAVMHSMASESDSGSLSDGDPPGFEGKAPPPPIAPRPELPQRARSGSRSSLAGSTPATAPNPAPASSNTPALTAAPGSAPRLRTKRSFEELEDTVFAHPRSFLREAVEIAKARDVEILVAEDRTHKTSSAYMHLVCPYRRTGCPLHIKLTRAAGEDGWVMKGPRPHDNHADTKQRSVYRCRHPAAGVPDFTVGQPIEHWLTNEARRSGPSWRLPGPLKPSASTTADAPPVSLMMDVDGAEKESTPGRLDGGTAANKPTPRRSTRLETADSASADSSKLSPEVPRRAEPTRTSSDGRLRIRLSTGSSAASTAREGTPSNSTARPAVDDPASERAAKRATPPLTAGASPGSALNPDRALAPPFQRALDLQAQIVPALGRGTPSPGTTLAQLMGYRRPVSESPTLERSGLPAASNGAMSTSHAPLTTATPVAPPSAAAGSRRDLPQSRPDPLPTAPPPANAMTVKETLQQPHRSYFSPPEPFSRPCAPSVVAAGSAAAAATVAGGVATPIVAASDPSAVQQWTRFLQELGEPSLVPLARVLGSAAVSVTPRDFFAGEADDDLREQLVEALPASAIGIWPKLLLAKRFRERGRAVWERLQRGSGSGPGREGLLRPPTFAG
ncbi:hypothetical protein JCM8202v2_001712 [Rhodotorula sphaerocarpa]